MTVSAREKTGACGWENVGVGLVGLLSRGAQSIVAHHTYFGIFGSGISSSSRAITASDDIPSACA